MQPFAMCSLIFSERQRKWKEELDQELERKRGRYTWFLSVPLTFFHFLFSFFPSNIAY